MTLRPAVGIEWAWLPPSCRLSLCAVPRVSRASQCCRRHGQHRWRAARRAVVAGAWVGLESQASLRDRLSAVAPSSAWAAFRARRLMRHAHHRHVPATDGFYNVINHSASIPLDVNGETEDSFGGAGHCAQTPQGKAPPRAVWRHAPVTRAPRAPPRPLSSRPPSRSATAPPSDAQLHGRMPRVLLRINHQGRRPG